MRAYYSGEAEASRLRDTPTSQTPGWESGKTNSSDSCSKVPFIRLPQLFGTIGSTALHCLGGWGGVLLFLRRLKDASMAKPAAFCEMPFGPDRLY